MPKTKAKAAADNRWDAANMKLLQTKVRREKAEAFAALCKQRGTTPSAVLRAAVEAYMEEAAHHD